MTFRDEYTQGERAANGSCPIESGLLASLADHECAHGRLPGDATRRCGCWAEEGAVLRVIEGQQPLFDVPEAKTA